MKVRIILFFLLIGAISWVAAANAAGSAAKGLEGPYEVSEIIGTHVITPDGLYLGRITDLIMGPDGRVALAVLSEGGFLTLNERRVVVPFDSFSYMERERYFVLNVARHKLDTAPTFSKDDLNDPRWAEDVFRYYGLQPSWTGGTVGTEKQDG